MSSDNETDSDIEYTPPNLRAEAKLTENLLPAKSKERYIKSYDQFVIWKSEKKEHKISENVLLAYFNDLAKSKQPSTLWAIYSMLKCTIQTNHNIDIKEYKKVTSFLKRQSTGFQSKKSIILTSENINRFLNEAPDDKFLATKVALILGINGACRSAELTNIKINDIKCDEIMIVILRDTNTHIDRTFVVRDEFIKIVKKYQNLRPLDTTSDRFFLNYINGKCTKQPIGRNKIASMPKEIAKYLELPNAERYTGHCFRRSSATLLADSGANFNLTTLKRHGGWKSDKVAEIYIEDSIHNKSDTSLINVNIKLEPRTKRHSSVSGQSLEESFANKVSGPQPSTSDPVSSPQASTSLKSESPARDSNLSTDNYDNYYLTTDTMLEELQNPGSVQTNSTSETITSKTLESHSYNQTSQSKKTRMNTTENNDQLLEKEKKKREILQRESMKEKSADLLFFESLLPYMENIPIRRKLRLRSKIQDLILAEIEAVENTRLSVEYELQNLSEQNLIHSIPIKTENDSA